MANIDAFKILGSLLNSGTLSRGSGSNVLGSVIGAVTGGGGQSGGGLGGLLGGLLGGGRAAPQPQAGGLGGLLGGLMGGGQSSGGGLGDLLGMAMKHIGGSGQGGAQQAQFDVRERLPQGVNYEQANDQATLLIKAMINAAKADGHVDKQEQQRIVEKLGDVTQDEIDFVRNELAQPLDTERFVRSVPRGMEQQVYAVSLMAIDLDSNPEAQYLHQLAQGTGITPEVCNAIHEQFGAPKLYK